jgi:hypothetical protein
MVMYLIDNSQQPEFYLIAGGNVGVVSVSVVQSVLLVVGIAFGLALTAAWGAFLAFELFSLVVSLF